MWKYFIIAGVLASLCGVVIIQNKVIESRTAQREQHKANAEAYKATLDAYRSGFAAMVGGLNAERRAEIERNENLLRTLNLIGDINESENSPVPYSSLAIIDGLYGPKNGTAASHP